MARFEFFERIHGVSNLMRANEAEQTATMNTKVVDYEYQEENRDTVLKNRSVSNGSHKTTPLRN